MQNDDLNPELRRRELPTEVMRARQEYAARATRAEEVLRPRVEAHISTCRMALDALDAQHQRVAGATDLDLVGDTRPAAIWQMAGRCIGLGRALLDLLRLGYCGETIVLARAIHECTRLLSVFGEQGEDELLRKWLADEDDEWVKPGEVRKAMERADERMAQAMREAGVDAIQSQVPQSRTMYDYLSRAGHSRRVSVQDSVENDLRRMATGPHPNPVRRAAYVGWGGAVIEEITLFVGEALAPFFGDGFYEKQIKSLLQSYQAIRQAAPLDPDSVAKLR